MKCFIFCVALLFICIKGNAQNQYQLAPPLLHYRSLFFTDTAMLAMNFQQFSATIHYTLNGKEPSASDPVYKKPLIFKDRITTLKARTFGQDFLPSETVQLTFIKSGLPFTVLRSTVPDEKYKGSGINTLTDNIGGIPNSSNDNWLGFKNDTVEIELKAEKAFSVKEVLLNFLQNEDGWIFLPVKIEASAEIENKYQLIAADSTNATASTSGNNSVYRELITNKKVTTSKLLIRIFTLKTIPDWHPAKGNHAWIFIDEIKVY